MNYITPSDAAATKNCSARRIQVLAKDGRIPGAKQMSNGTWLIPEHFKVTKSNPKRMQLTKLATAPRAA